MYTFDATSVVPNKCFALLFIVSITTEDKVDLDQVWDRPLQSASYFHSDQRLLTFYLWIVTTFNGVHFSMGFNIFRYTFSVVGIISGWSESYTSVPYSTTSSQFTRQECRELELRHDAVEGSEISYFSIIEKYLASFRLKIMKGAVAWGSCLMW